MLKLLALKPFSSRLPRGRTRMPSMEEAMDSLRQLLEVGKLTPTIDSSYPLDQVPEAMRHLQSGRACGKIIISIG